MRFTVTVYHSEDGLGRENGGKGRKNVVRRLFWSPNERRRIECNKDWTEGSYDKARFR